MKVAPIIKNSTLLQSWPNFFNCSIHLSFEERDLSLIALIDVGLYPLYDCLDYSLSKHKDSIFNCYLLMICADNNVAYSSLPLLLFQMWFWLVLLSRMESIYLLVLRDWKYYIHEFWCFFEVCIFWYLWF